MSIASRLTSIEGHIEDDYNELERLGADLTNVDKNIENIASVVNSIYDKLPKVTGTGSNVSLTPTLKGGLGINPLGTCEQTGTPTPSSPIDVKVVTGDNSVVVQNKNLFDGEIEVGSINPADGSLVVNVTRTRSKNYTEVRPHTTYTITRTNNVGFLWIVGYNSNKVGISDGLVGNPSGIAQSEQNATTLTFTTTPTTKFIKWYQTTGLGLNEQIQREVGSTATSYVAHQEQSTTLHLDGNIFDKTNLIDGWVRGSNGNYETTYGTTYSCTDFLEVQPNQAYIIDLYNYTGLDSGGIVEYNNSKTYIKSTPETQRIVTFTTTENTKYIRFTVRKDSINNVIYAIGNTLPTPIELCKIGDYQDVITGSIDNWKVVRNVGKVVLDGSEETWSLVTSGETPYYRFRYLSDTITGTELFCNMFIKSTISTAGSDLGCAITSSGEFRCREATMQTLENWKAFLSTQNLILYYQLEESTETPITDTTLITDLNNLQKLLSYDGTTNITITSDSSNAQMSVEVSALKGE